VAEANGNILSEQKTTFGDYPAREFEYKAGGKANYSAKVKYVMIGQRVYSLMAVFMTGNPYPEDRTTFFNSFRLQN
jgi:tetrahydromethanopterin S-methyltransferase subunit B